MWRSARVRHGLALLFAAAGLVCPAARGEAARGLVVWRLEGGRLVLGAPGADSGTDAPVPVGSLQKPFLAEAWARAHPGATPPLVTCDRTSGCWRPSGHGRVDLRQALGRSCNTYFRRLAADVPVEVLAATLRDAGFVVPDRLTPDAAIGLATPDGTVAIRPSALLAAYVQLTRRPWPTGEEIRSRVLAGLRDAPLTGTAAGLEARGFWAKTGTVADPDAGTDGWTVAVDDSGWAILGLFRHGVGRDAARELSAVVERLRPGATRHAADRSAGSVRVLLFETLHPRAIEARNIGAGPVATSRGFAGPGARLALSPGDALEPGTWELRLKDSGLVRRLRGRLSVGATGDGLRVVADLDRREYVAGVLLAELPAGTPALRVELGAATLRFLAAGPRHGSADVCDSTHCAWFVGRGPRTAWLDPRHATLLPDVAGPEPGGLDDELWSRIQELAQLPGPAQWTRHCGGAPLSPHAVWGGPDRRVEACSRHHAASAGTWSRRWQDAALEAVFGGRVTRLALAEPDGVWTLRVEVAGRSRDLRYDAAHRALAERLGWDALPSPASRVFRVAGGYQAEGVGEGHRVGLCLGD